MFCDGAPVRAELLRCSLLFTLIATGGCGDETAEVEPTDPWETLRAQGPTVREILGVSTHMYQGLEENAHRDFEFEIYEALGGIRIREDYRWRHFEPEDDVWDFDRVRGQVNQAVALNMPITAMLGYGVEWAMGTTDRVPSNIDPAEYGEFAGAVAAEYCDEISEYELWNEPNLTRFWEPAPDPAHYGEFVKQAHTAIKAACPEARVVFGGLASYDFVRTFERWWFLDEVWVAHPDICDYFDVLGIHPYTALQKASPENNTVLGEGVEFWNQSRMTQMARDKLTTLGCPDLPVHYTEAGWPSYELSEETQGRYLARGVLLAARDHVESYTWYTFWDSTPTTEGLRPHEAYFGLFGWRGEDGNTRRPKASYRAMLGLANILGDAQFAGDLSEAFELPEKVFALAFMHADRQITLALWDARDDPDLAEDGTRSEGGPDTQCDVSLPLPEGTAGLTLVDLEGEPMEAPAVAKTLSLTLTPAVQYLTIER